MSHCPDCRSPIQSLMLLDGKETPEYYCGTCDRGWPLVRRDARVPTLASR